MLHTFTIYINAVPVESIDALTAWGAWTVFKARYPLVARECRSCITLV